MLDIVHMDEVLAAGTSGRGHFVSWRGVMTSEALQTVYQSLARHHGRLGERPLCISIMSVGSAMELPDNQVRQTASEVALKCIAHQASTAMVLEGEGFGASAARAVISGIYMVQSRTVKQKVVSSVQEAAAWTAEVNQLSMAERTQLASDASELRRRHLAH